MKLKALTPRDDLYGNEDSFVVYKDYLDEAFDNPKIRNLALSGSLGSGKSSIIRSYDRARNYGKKHFLYVSLMSFSNHVDGTATDDQKQLEYSLLNQIMSCCTAKDLPEGSINGIPEKFKWLRTCAVCLSMLCFSIYMLIFHAQFGKLAGMLFKELEGATFLGFEVSNLFSEGARFWVHLGLYVLIGVILCVCVYCILRRCLPFFQLSKLTVKANNAEAEVLMGKERSSLDVYKFELAYALEKMGKKYDYTVVFEDLERLDTSVAVEIMEKLRELNTLTNNHIQATRTNRVLRFLRGGFYKERVYYQNGSAQKKRCEERAHFIDKFLARNLIRFIYPISEQTIKQEYRAKFYDCIIPVIPVSNPLNGKAQLSKLLGNLSINDPYRKELCDSLSEAILDYRTRLTLKNEFNVLWALSKQKETEDDSSKPTMFAIAAYKVLLPQCFEYALSPNGIGQLPEFNSHNDDDLIKAYPEEDQRKRVFKAISSLQSNGLLNRYCLRLIVGEKQLIEHQLTILRNMLTKSELDNADIILAEQLILNVATFFEKAASKKIFNDFRKLLIPRLHKLLSKNKETLFVLTLRSLFAVSRPSIPNDWFWVIPTYKSEKYNWIYFSRLIQTISNTAYNLVLPGDFYPKFLEWCINILIAHTKREGYYISDWNDEMADKLAMLFMDTSIILQNKDVAELVFNGSTLLNRMNRLKSLSN